MKQLAQTDSRRLPFTPGIPGFNPTWWQQRSVPPGKEDFAWYAFELDGEEVGRAEVNWRSRVHRDYVVPALPIEVVEITFIEVRGDLRGNRIGPTALDRIMAQYPGAVFAASPVDANGFWTRIEWKDCIRRERQPVGNHLFILDRRHPRQPARGDGRR